MIQVTHERWPGYDEQSWQERFAELDRRYNALGLTMPDAAKRWYDAGRIAALEEAAGVCESLCFFTDIEELREMTKQQMSERTCHEAATAIRNLKEPTP